MRFQGSGFARSAADLQAWAVLQPLENSARSTGTVSAEIHSKLSFEGRLNATEARPVEADHCRKYPQTDPRGLHTKAGGGHRLRAGSQAESQVMRRHLGGYSLAWPQMQPSRFPTSASAAAERLGRTHLLMTSGQIDTTE